MSFEKSVTFGAGFYIPLTKESLDFLAKEWEFDPAVHDPDGFGVRYFFIEAAPRQGVVLVMPSEESYDNNPQIGVMSVEGALSSSDRLGGFRDFSDYRAPESWNAVIDPEKVTAENYPYLFELADKLSAKVGVLVTARVF